MSGCKFCLMSEGKLSCHKVWEDSRFLAFLDIHPISPGHTLLIPKPHMEYIFEMDEQLYLELFRIARELSGPIRRVTGSKRIGIAVEGFSVPHVHIHLVPVNEVNELDPNRAAKATDEELSVVAAKVRAKLRAIH